MRKIYSGENRFKAIRQCFCENRSILEKPESMEEHLLLFNKVSCRPPLSSENDLKAIHNLAQSVTTPESATTEADEIVVVKDVARVSEIELEDTPDSVLSGRLGEICQRRMLKYFPVAYAWPSLVTAAGILVPMSPRPTGTTIGDDDDLTNFYTGLVGPVHSGKSQAIEWGAKLMGIFKTKNYSEVKAGSAEGLFDKIRKDQEKGFLGDNVLLNLDEWLHFFNKAGIDRASFATVLTTGFYRRHQSLIVAGRKDIEIDCMLSWIGGIVTDQYEECFGSSSIGGLYDRFFHGLCPTEFNFDYRPFEGAPELVAPIQVAIDPSVWEVTSDWRKEDPSLGRSIELAVRTAKVCAAFDNRPVLFGKDLDAFKTFATDQSRIRKFLKPNVGDNPDAAFSNAVLSWLDRKVPDARWISSREVKRGVNSYRLRLGPGVAERALSNLARLGEIDLVNNKTAGARGPAGEYIRRVKS